MQSRTFTLLDLAVVFVVLAIGCAAVLGGGNPFSAWLFTIVTLWLVLYGLLNAMIWRLEAPFWLGFFIFGFVHFLIGYLPQHFNRMENLALMLINLGYPLKIGDIGSWQTSVTNAVTVVFATLGGLSAVVTARARRTSPKPNGAR